MDWRILGPLSATGPDGELGRLPLKQRVLLAILLLHANQQVPIGLLIDGLWDGRPPASARANLQSYVAGLRRALPEAEILTTAAGYQLVVSAGSLDAAEFEERLNRGRDELAAGRHTEAARLLGEALHLWRGDVLAGIELPAALRAPVTRLAELRVLAVEARFEARLGSGEDAGLVPELVWFTEAFPLRETLRGQLMLALHRAGRTPEALAAYRAFRERLVDEVGVEPSEAVQQLHRQILSGTAQREAVPAAEAPNQLPADVAGFVGRERQLRLLDAAKAAKAPVVVISGMAGAGKTALAIRWAHRVAAGFPDGLIYLNLRGYSTDDPLSPLAAVTLVLRALGVAAASVPVDVDEAVGMYRTLLAQRRVLLVLDNAREADQVRPLLPGGAACMTLVTSRDRLTGLVVRDNARPVPIEPLSDEESLDLLQSILGTASGRPTQLAELARACAGLPLALRIAAAKYAERSGLDADFAEEDRLEWLKVSGDAQASVRAAFEASYRLLAEADRRLFRLLGLIPGATFTVAVAAALAGAGPSTRDSLRALVAAHLVEQHEHGYALHDLLRRYARDKATEDEAGPAMLRLCAYYEAMVEASARMLYDTMLRLPDARPAEPNPLADAVAAREWLDAELPNLVALIHEAAADGVHRVAGLKRTAWRLADGLRGYFWIRRPVAEWLATAGDGLTAANAEGDAQAIAAMHMSLGLAWRTIGQHSSAEENLHAAKTAAAQAGWREAHASALGHLAVSHAERGDNGAAVDLLTQALELNRKMGRRAGEAVVLTNMGTLQYHLGALARSAEYTQAALEAYREVGNLGGEGLALSNLGITHVYLGQRERAWAYLTEGQRIFDRIGDRIGLAEGGYAFAKLHAEAGDYQDAEKHAVAAIELAEGAGDGALAGICQAELSHIRFALGRSSDVVGRCLAARASAKSANNVYAELWTVIFLARAYAVTDRAAEARETAEEGVELAVRWGYRLLEGEARRVLAEVLLDTGDANGAAASAELAIGCLGECGYRLGVERARELRLRALA